MSMKERGLYQQPGSKNWYYDFVVNGERYRGSTRCSNKVEAREVLAALRSKATQSPYGVRIMREIRFFELMHRYFDARDPLKPSNVNYITQARVLEAFFGNITISQFTPESLQRYISARMAGKIKVNGKLARQVKRTTVNRDLSFLRSVFYFAFDNELYNGRNPVKKGMIDHSADDEARRLEYLTVDEINQYLNACAEQYFPVALCALECGMRRGEISNLKWADIDFNQRTLTIRKSKGGKQRTLPMSERLTAVVRGLKCKQQSNEFVFVNREGLQYKDFRSAHRHTLLRSGLAKTRELAGKPPLRFHDLRHTCATLLLKETRNLYLVSTQLGHSKIETTQIYAHVMEESQRDGIELISKQISDSCHNNVIVGNFSKGEKSDGAKKPASIKDF